jgi:transposase
LCISISFFSFSSFFAVPVNFPKEEVSMTIVGFDVAKENMVGVRIDKQTKVKETFVIDNNEEAIVALLEGLQAKQSKLTVACESTGDCHRALALACLDRAIPCRVINPITTKQFTRATVRKKKTDLTDAHIIAKLAVQGEGVLVTPGTFLSSKTFIRTGLKITQLRVTLRRIKQRFTGIFPKEEELIATLEENIKQLEKTSQSFQEKASEQVDPALQQLLCSVPGVGKVVSTVLIAEIGSIERFGSAQSLVAYAGLDPKVRQSGTSLHRNTNLTKRGSTYLRTGLFQAAAIARMHDPILKAYYEKKRGEGKEYREAVVAVARKLVHYIYAIWTKGEPYAKKAT